MPFMETSAKTGLNVELAFLAVARYDFDKINQRKIKDIVNEQCLNRLIFSRLYVNA